MTPTPFAWAGLAKDVPRRSAGEAVLGPVQKRVVQLRWTRAALESLKLHTGKRRIAEKRPSTPSCPPEAANTRQSRTFGATLSDGGSVVTRILEVASSSWSFDAFSLARVTGNRPLSTLGMFLFGHLGLVEEFHLNQRELQSFFLEIERGYDDANPYHNRAHAASVLHSMHAMLEHGNLLETLPAGKPRDAKLMRMACLLAAAMHDFEHLGLSNDFLVKTHHQRALKFSNKNVNERHHAAAAFDVLLGHNFLKQLPPQEFVKLKGLVVDLVLATDMSLHRMITEAADSWLAGREGCCGGPAAESGTPLSLQLAIKCADLGHAALDWEHHLQWVQLLETEFFLQGDRERQAGMPVSFLMDRRQPGLSEGQSGFFSGVVLPLFGLLAQAAPQCRPFLEAAEENSRLWASPTGAAH